MSSENKEETLASFQAITGIDDVGEAFSHLEAVNWNLLEALSRVMPHDDTPAANAILLAEPPTTDPGQHFNSNGFTVPQNEDLPGPSSVATRETATASGVVFSDVIKIQNTNQQQQIFPTPQFLAQLTSSINLDPSKQNNNRNTIIFNIHFNHQIYEIHLPMNATIEQLKNKIYDVTQVPQCRQAIRGWPPSKAGVAQLLESQLCNLDLAAENELILVDLTDDGFMDTEQDDISLRMNKMFTIKIFYDPNGAIDPLSLIGHTTILELKTKVYYITNIPVRHQEWSGWPSGCDSETTLAQSGIHFSHNFVLRNNASRQANSSNILNSNEAVAVDSGSSADEFEDATDFNNTEYLFTDSPPLQPTSRHLIPNNTDDEIQGSSQFVENYKHRYGQPHPDFFIGSLENALHFACHKPAKDRKMLAIYLHNGESILTNVFCDHLMKHESIIQTFRENLVLYGWDMTYESNKDMFLASITACISSNASLTARNIKLDKMPAIMLIGKSRQLGRNCGVLSVIHGNLGLDELLTRVMATCEIYDEQLQVEIRDELERAARDQVKAEQDEAYEATLQADMAKEAAKRQKEAAQAAEHKRIQSEKAVEAARRESIRLRAERSLPQEPSEFETVNISKVRVRKPTGDYLERRFYTNDSLQDLLNFVAASGFLIEEYKIFSGWPRRDLTSYDASQTLEALKLYPQETVILEER